MGEQNRREERIHPAWRTWMGRTVVVDTDSQYVYLGKLTAADEDWVVLENAEVHDIGESRTTREQYLCECLEFGIRPNRGCVWVLRERVVSISRLEDMERF